MLGKAKREATLISVVLGIGIHKVFEAFAVGAALIEAQIPRNQFAVLATIFVLASPIGAALGYFAREQEPSESPMGAIVNALAAGTFLQVAAMEMLPKAYSRTGGTILKLCYMAAGFGLVCLLTWKYPHQH